VNWWLLDPFFNIRLIFHFFHPNSPLSHPALTKQVFFSNAVSDDYVLKFQARTSAYESYLWPFGMMKPFTNPLNIIRQISGWGSSDRLLVLFGSGDKLMTAPIMQKLARFYRNAVIQLSGHKKIDVADDGVTKLGGDGDLDEHGQGVRYCVVPVAGHHLQNDVQWEVGAKKLLEFYEQL